MTLKISDIYDIGNIQEQSLSDCYSPPLKARDLHHVARVLIDFERHRSGERLNVVFRRLSGVRKAELSDAEVNDLIARSKGLLKPLERVALEAIAAHVPEVFSKPSEREAFENEVARRLNSSDYNGAKGAPDWISTGDLRSMPQPQKGGDDPEQTQSVSDPEVEWEKTKVREASEVRLFFTQWADQLGIPKETGSQSKLKSLAGEYLIVRYLCTVNKIIASHMTVRRPPHDSLPAAFATRGGEGKGRHDFSRVEGVAFTPTSSCDLITLGRIGKETNIRAAFLTTTEKTAPIHSGPDYSQLENRDLYGLRISPGSLIRGQVAYRIWCSKLLSKEARQAAKDNLSTYSIDDARDVFSSVIDDFEDILQWVTEVQTLTVDEVFPPAGNAR